MDFSRYALMLENKAFVVEANPTQIEEAATLKAADTDSAEVKLVKDIINNPKTKKEQYDSIIKQVELLTSNADEKVTSQEITFKDGDKDVKVKVNRKKDDKGKFAVWFEAMPVAKTADLTKIDFDYLAAQINEAIDGIGTDDDALARVGAAMRLYAMRNADGDIKPILDKLREKYNTVYEESLDEAIDGDMDRYDLEYMQYLYGITQLNGAANGSGSPLAKTITGVGTVNLTEETVFEYTTKLKNLADENMDNLDTQKSIATMILGLNETSAKMVKANWEKNYASENFMEFVITEEFVDGVVAVLKAYWSAVSGEGDSGVINGYLAKMEKGGGEAPKA